VRLLVTGGAGFIGSNFVRLALGESWADRLVVLDLLTYAGNLDNLAEVAADRRFVFVRGDIADAAAVERTLQEHGPFDAVVNFAAESHVDRSIEDPSAFVRTNVGGTQVLLDAAVRHRAAWRDLQFLQVSTDEVYGSLDERRPDLRFTESSPLDPSSPYAASKAGADLLARAYAGTFGLRVDVTRGSNNYGPYQFPEKLIPLFVTNALEDEALPLYGDGLQIRDWMHVEDYCRAIRAVLEHRRGDADYRGDVFNFGGDGAREWTNRDITGLILSHLGKPQSLVRPVADRRNHDRRYAVDCSKAKRVLGWRPRYALEAGLPATIEWYGANRAWWRKVKSGTYRQDYERLYRDKWLAAGS
jgi:dTDP-glucose 4,6-dehydratase